MSDEQQQASSDSTIVQISENTSSSPDLTAIVSWFANNFKAVGLKRLAAQYMDVSLLPDESDIKPLAVPSDLDMNDDDAYAAFKQEAQKVNGVAIENIVRAMDASGSLKNVSFWNDVAKTTPFKVEEIETLAKAYASDLQLPSKNEHLMNRFHNHMR